MKKITRQRLKTQSLGTRINIGNVDRLYAEVVEGQRTAKCSSCGFLSNSQDDLPFFKETPDKPHDEYYCGDRGWN